jgi:hypothetical protein
LRTNPWNRWSDALVKQRHILVAFFALCLLAFKGAADPGSIRVSLIQDPGAGAAARHGVQKVEAALQVKGLRYEEVANLQAAHGQIVIRQAVRRQNAQKLLVSPCRPLQSPL